jgi:hypothetical protein
MKKISSAACFEIRGRAGHQTYGQNALDLGNLVEECGEDPI